MNSNRPKTVEEIKDLQTIIKELDRELKERITNLNSAFEKAFKDKNEDHPSQLVYQAIYAEFQRIFSHIDGSGTEEEIKKKFADLKAQLPGFVGAYFEENRDALKEKSALMKKMGIVNIDTYRFDPVEFYSSLSTEKQQIFPFIIDAFQEMALQHFYLKQGIKQEVNASIEGLQKTLLGAYEEQIESIHEILSENYSHGEALFNTKGKKRLDKLQSHASDEHALREELAGKLQEKRDDIFKVVGKNYGALNERLLRLIRYPEALRRDIEQYQKHYAAVQQAIAEGHFTEQHQIDLQISTLNSNRQKLEERIAALKELADVKQGLLKDLKREVEQTPGRDYQVTPMGEDEIYGVSALKNIRGHLDELNFQVFGYIQDSKTITPISGLGVKANQLFNAAVDRMRRFVDDSIEITMMKSAKENHRSYVGHVNSAGRLKSELQDQCRAQTKTGNPLWEEAASAVDANLTPSSFQIAFGNNNELRDRLINSEIKAFKEYIERTFISHNQEAHQNNLRKLAEKVEAARKLLEEYARSCQLLLRKLEAGIYVETIEAAKEDYLGKLKQLEGMVNEFKVPSDLESVALPKPSKLQDVFNAKQRERERLESEERKARQRIEEEKKKKEKQQEEIERQQRKLEEKNAERKRQIRQHPHEAMLQIQSISSRLDGFFYSRLQHPLYQKYADLKEQYHQAWEKEGSDCVADFIDSYTEMERSVAKEMERSVKTTPPSGKKPPQRPESDDIESGVLVRVPVKKRVKNEKPGFFKRHWKAIVATTTSFALVGAAGGAGLGVAIGLGAIPFTLGASLPATPILATIMGAIGLVGGAIVGFVAGVAGSAIADCCKPEIELEDEAKNPLLNEDGSADEKPSPSRSPSQSPSVLRRGSQEEVVVDVDFGAIQNDLDEVQRNLGFTSTVSTHTSTLYGSRMNGASSTQRETMERLAEFEMALAKAVIVKLHEGNQATQRKLQSMLDRKTYTPKDIITKNTRGEGLVKECAEALLADEFKDLQSKHFEGSYLKNYVQEAFRSRYVM